MKSVMENKGANKPPMPREIRTVSPFSGKTNVSLKVHLTERDDHAPQAAIKRENTFFSQVLQNNEGMCIDLDMTPPRKMSRMTGSNVTLKMETNEITSKPINYGLVDLVSDDEGQDALAAPMSSRPSFIPNPTLDMEGMEMDDYQHEDVFNHGGGLNGDDSF